MKTTDVYVLIECPHKGVIRVHYMPKNDFIANHVDTRVFVRSGIKFHAIATGFGNKSLREMKRILNDLWYVMESSGMIQPVENLPEPTN